MQKTNDEETFQLQALEIREPDENFDPLKPPQTGEEFLMHMLYERKRCPAVVTKRSTKIKSIPNNGCEQLVSVNMRYKCKDVQLENTYHYVSLCSHHFRHTNACCQRQSGVTPKWRASRRHAIALPHSAPS